ncbi:heat shock factor binding protein 1-domain-containing protein [Phellopilus nigrolimitatus]|nr:heat shock factor binding protein 1-domain-containing protein [Phellopilus nigrolimitatus]
MSSAKPLKIPSSTPSKPPSAAPKPVADTPSTAAASLQLNPSDITSPHELTAFVETLLEQLDTKFDDMSSQFLKRMDMMSTRVDALEVSIQDIINGDITAGASVPQSPGLGGVRRTGST